VQCYSTTYKAFRCHVCELTVCGLKHIPFHPLYNHFNCYSTPSARWQRQQLYPFI